MSDIAGDPRRARNDDQKLEEEGVREEGTVANPGPVPEEAEDATDVGEEPGDLAPHAANPEERA